MEYKYLRDPTKYEINTNKSMFQIGNIVKHKLDNTEMMIIDIQKPSFWGWRETSIFCKTNMYNIEGPFKEYELEKIE